MFAAITTCFARHSYHCLIFTPFARQMSHELLNSPPQPPPPQTPPLVEPPAPLPDHQTEPIPPASLAPSRALCPQAAQYLPVALQQLPRQSPSDDPLPRCTSLQFSANPPAHH